MRRIDRLNDMIPIEEKQAGTFVEYRFGRGWFLDNFNAPRHFGDEGDFLGRKWQEAKERLEWLYKNWVSAK